MDANPNFRSNGATAKKPVVPMSYPKAIKAFYMRLNDHGRTKVRASTSLRQADAQKAAS